jgi:hypothetical protein
VVDSIVSGEAKGYEREGNLKSKSEYEEQCVELMRRLQESCQENEILKKQVARLEVIVSDMGAEPGLRSKLHSAQLTDSIVNGA